MLYCKYWGRGNLNIRQHCKYQTKNHNSLQRCTSLALHCHETTLGWVGSHLVHCFFLLFTQYQYQYQVEEDDADEDGNFGW